MRSVVEAHCDDRGAIGSVPVRAVATLYLLLMSHPVDRRGRCRSCRRPGEVVGLRRRRCRVQRTAHFYLHHPDDEFLLSHLAREMDLPAPAGSRLDDTDVLPRITDPDDPPTTSQSPAASPPPLLPGGFPRAGRPVPDHGGAGERPERPRSRRGPSGEVDDPEPVPGGSLLVGRGAA